MSPPSRRTATLASCRCDGSILVSVAVINMYTSVGANKFITNFVGKSLYAVYIDTFAVFKVNKCEYDLFLLLQGSIFNLLFLIFHLTFSFNYILLSCLIFFIL